MAVRRSHGSGSIYFASGPKVWVFAMKKPAGKTVITRRRFCHVLSEVSRRGLWESPELKPRLEALRMAREKGSHTGAEWLTYVAQRESRCEYCGRDCGADPTKDHRIPISKGGSDGIENLAVCCLACNQHKSTSTEREFREWLDLGGLQVVLSKPVSRSRGDEFWRARGKRVSYLLGQGYVLEDALRMAMSG